MEAGYKTLLLVVYKASLFSVCPKWLVISPHFFRSSQLAVYKTLLFWGRNSQKVFFQICLTIRPLEFRFDLICISLIKVKIWRFCDYRPWMTFNEPRDNFFRKSHVKSFILTYNPNESCSKFDLFDFFYYFWPWTTWKPKNMISVVFGAKWAFLEKKYV